MELKRILIISYFFPPCNLTASQRVFGMAKYLSDNGYYPIIIARNWDIQISYPEDILASSGNEIKIEKFENYEIHSLPYKSSLRDKCFRKSVKNKLFKPISKVLTLFNLFTEKFTNYFIPFSNLYSYSKKIIKQENINKVIISGNPFVQFKFGYLLKKELKVKWVADYRDGWYTRELVNPKKGFKGLVTKFESTKEKKWVGSAEFFTSVSKLYVDEISNFVQKKGYVISNGYDNIRKSNVSVDKTLFRITYNGTLYPEQPIESFLDVIILLVNDEEIKLHLMLDFPGLGFDPIQENRVKSYMKGYEENYNSSGRIPHEEVISLQQKSDLLLMISYGHLKGIPSSKLYEYIGLKKPVLLYPNDFDIIEETLQEVNCGIICDNKDELYHKLKEVIISKQRESFDINGINLDKVEFYSRKSQIKEFAKLLDTIE